MNEKFKTFWKKLLEGFAERNVRTVSTSDCWFAEKGFEAGYKQCAEDAAQRAEYLYQDLDPRQWEDVQIVSKNIAAVIRKLAE